MINDSYSKREQDHFFGELFKRMDNQDVILQRIEAQTTRTNGRVTILEEKTKDYPHIRNRVWWIVGVGSSTVILVGVIYTLSIQNIFNRIDMKFTELQAASLAAIDAKFKASLPSSFTNSVSVN